VDQSWQTITPLFSDLVVLRLCADKARLHLPASFVL